MAKTTAESNAIKASRKREQVAELYRTRLTHLKKAQLYIRDEHMAKAVDSYTKYLDILAIFFDTTEDKLSPTLFDAKKDVTELLLISHAYWDLAKAFDRSPNSQRECFRCLEQFIKFSIDENIILYVFIISIFSFSVKSSNCVSCISVSGL